MIKPESIPKSLHPLIPLVERWSYADDEERLARITSATRDECAEFLAVMKAHREPLRAWLQTTDVTQSDDWMAIAWLDTAEAEVAAMEKRAKR